MKKKIMDKKPNFETESFRMWKGKKEDINDLDIENSIEVTSKNGMKLNLCGFNKYIDKDTNELVIALKFKHDKKQLLYYIPDNYLMNAKVTKAINMIKELNKHFNYNIQDAKDFIERVSYEKDTIEKI